jgi:hypothetical protein
VSPEAEKPDLATKPSDIQQASSTEGLPVAPSMGPALESARAPLHATVVDGRVIFITVIAMVIGLATGLVAQILIHLIGFITNVAFYGRLRNHKKKATG